MELNVLTATAASVLLAVLLSLSSRSVSADDGILSAPAVLPSVFRPAAEPSVPAAVAPITASGPRQGSKALNN